MWEGSCVTALAAWASPPGRRGRHRQGGDAGVYTDRLKWPLGAVLGRLCTLLRREDRASRRWGRRSVHRSAKMVPRSRFGAFVYTVAPWAWVVGGLGIAIVYTNGRIGPLRAGLGRLCTLLGCCAVVDRCEDAIVYTDRRNGLSAPFRGICVHYCDASRDTNCDASCVRWHKRLSHHGVPAAPPRWPSRLVGKTGSARAAPLPGWRLRRGINPHEPPKSLISCSVLGGKMLLTGSPV